MTSHSNIRRNKIISINRVVLVGRLTKDPELKYSQSGVGICNFTVAVNRNFKTQDGQDADFINCVVFKKAAESLANYQRKGNQVGIEGRIQTRTYENNEGKTVFVTEVIADSVQFLDPKTSHSANKQENISQGEPVDLGDNLPF